MKEEKVRLGNYLRWVIGNRRACGNVLAGIDRSCGVPGVGVIHPRPGSLNHPQQWLSAPLFVVVSSRSIIFLLSLLYSRFQMKVQSLFAPKIHAWTNKTYEMCGASCYTFFCFSCFFRNENFAVLFAFSFFTWLNNIFENCASCTIKIFFDLYFFLFVGFYFFLIVFFIIVLFASVMKKSLIA